ncbi:MAG: glycosyltransferase family 2 protein [Candidatus Nomurabacteria bacterium]|nr:MAG: glycosyltransferase family 2 protein [Candidatus Nomurabacteria bacterium]
MAVSEKMKREIRTYRFLEILPGAFIWLTFAVTLVAIFWKPLWAIVFIIVFDVLWLVRITYVLTYIILAYTRYRRANKIDWLAQCQQPRLLGRFHQLKHVVVVPSFRDEFHIIDTSLRYLVESSVPREQIFVVLALEERDGERAHELGRQLSEKYGHQFGQWLVTYHPADLAGEMPGKGSNISWAGHRMKERIDELGWNYDDIIVTSLDVDSCVHREYLACLSYEFMTQAYPHRNSYQPIPVFQNNTWDAPAFTRVVASSTTFWLLSETIRNDRMFTFSSHSMSFRALVDVGFWQNDIVTEDSRIFLQCLVNYDGDYEVVPIYLPVSMDTVQGRTFWQSVVNQYKQIRRWAYGTENLPFMIWNFRDMPTMSLRKKLRYIWNQLEGEYSWATAPILIFVLGYAPLWVAPEAVRTTALFQSAPFVLQTILTLSLTGLFVSAAITWMILPPRPRKVKQWRKLAMIFQWVVFPITTIAFGSIPAIEAQTRLMLGKYLGFWTTEKVRSEESSKE